MDTLDGRVAVVTGAASGIGLALCERFLADGMRVVMADVEAPRLAQEVARLTDGGGDVLAVTVDVRDPAQVQHLVDTTLDTYGAAHLVCNNAGVAPVVPLTEMTPENWRWIVDVNVLGVAYGISAFAPLLIAQGVGHIVNTASEMGLATTPGFGPYAATKHAVVALSETLARELAGTGVGVSCMCPNLVNTDIFLSERNRTHAPELDADETARMAMYQEVIRSHGIAPAEVADAVADAVVHDRFWVITHPTTVDVSQRRGADIAAGRNPTDPYPHPEPDARGSS